MEVDSDANCVSEIVEIYVHGLVAAAMSLQRTIYGMKFLGHILLDRGRVKVGDSYMSCQAACQVNSPTCGCVSAILCPRTLDARCCAFGWKSNERVSLFGYRVIRLWCS